MPTYYYFNVKISCYNSRPEVDLSSTHKYKLVLQKFICGHLKVFFNN